MEIKKFYNGDMELGIYIEINPNEYDLRLVSQDMVGKRMKLSDYIESTPNAIAGINGGLFALLNNEKVIGVYKDSNGNIRGEENDVGPKILWDGKSLSLDWLKIGELTNYKWVRNAAYYGFLYNGEQSHDYLEENKGYYEGFDNRSMIGQKADGTIVLAATHPDKWMNAELQAKIMKDLGCVIGLNLDGGSSTQLYANGTEHIGNTRSVSDVILVCTKDPIDPEPTGKCTMKLFGSAAYLRDKEVTGEPQITIPNGTEFDVVGLYSWEASDGYRWGYGKYNGKEGYFQYDPAVMMPYGNNLDTLNYKMRLFNSAARIRSKVVDGQILTTVPNGNDITIIQFGKIIESDGYQWFQGSFNGVTGFLQYDPAVMFPTND